MFSLIITVVSIALVALLAIASLYYGGNAYTDSSQQTRANQIVNQAEQIASANTLYRTSHLAPASSISDLIDTGFLSSWQGEPWGISDGYIEAPAVGSDAQACRALNRQATGSDVVPSCDSVDRHDTQTICCTL